MDKNQYIWNLSQTRYVKMSQIKEFTLHEYDECEVRAWVNSNDYVTVFKASKQDCIEWLNGLVN